MFNATPLLKLYARRRLSKLAKLDPVKSQEQQLLALLKKAKDTKFGRDHNFANIKSVAEYQKAVPLRKYDNFWESYWKESFPVLENVSWPGKIPYFANSSGTTTGLTKYIPVTHEMVKSNERATLDVLSFHIANNPKSKILGGKNFMLGGSTDLKQAAPGVQIGDLSGIAAKEVPSWASARYFPPRDLATISDWETKTQTLAKQSLKEDIRTIGGTPSWVLLFLETLEQLKPGSCNITDYYPNLEMVVHGGVNFAPYRERFNKLLATSHAETREVYPASEGFMALADRKSGEGLRLVLDNGLFFEFVPVAELDSPNPTRHWIANAQKDIDYAMILTTCSGLWSYIIGDTIRFVDLSPPRILITGRTSYYLSAFGEHLIGEQIEHAVTDAATAIGASVTDYSVGPIYPHISGELGHHLYIVEFSGEASDDKSAEFIKIIDEILRRKNADYDEYREDNLRIKAPIVKIVPPGTFARWMKGRGKLGAQNKVPRVIMDMVLFQNLRDFINKDS